MVFEANNTNNWSKQSGFKRFRTYMIITDHNIDPLKLGFCQKHDFSRILDKYAKIHQNHFC